MIKREIPVVVAVVLMIACALVQAHQTRTFPFGNISASQEVLEYAARLDSVPMNIGPWKGKNDPPPSTTEIVVARIVGGVYRTYTHEKTNKSVSVFLVCGAHRDVAVHTPARCYPAAGYTMSKDEAPYTIDTDAGKADFYWAQFHKESAEGRDDSRVFWSWNHDGAWIAPTSPRFSLAGKPALFKVYLVSRPEYNEPVEETPSIEFAKEFIPAVQKVLFPDEAAPATESAAAAPAAPVEKS